MANYTISKRQRKNATVYCARVRVKENGVVTFSKSKTFIHKTAAIKWAKETVYKVEHNTNNTPFELIDCTLKTLIEKYQVKKNASDRPLRRTANYCFRQICTFPIADKLVTHITSADIVDFCRQRKESQSAPSPQTLSIDVSCLRKVLRVAKSMFHVNVDERPVIDAYPALHDLKLIARSARRERRLEQGEMQALLTELTNRSKHHCCIIPYVDIFRISLLTCCRISEVCNMRWDDLDRNSRTILLRDRKNPNGSQGNNSKLPLLGEALEIIDRQPKMDVKIFPYNPRSITAGFRRTRKKLGIKDLRYHDLRREGASRLIQLGMSVEEAARITGHKDLNILWQVYVVINPDQFNRFRDVNILGQ
ncbi:site-specific integrase [Bowmanella sp. Y26]|uniref:site-specific integrase n=1 Tax=Bowmanella yangjiangensis TaxID=2811230 RepID=UPI001BDC5967|nr:site-specific integrase [Bowmanella yangjiangensis]MBT1066146.1 site-specific integrase [Bowmanella yangjiangensis]